MKPTIGRIVLYTLSAQDAQAINDTRRSARGAAPGVSTSGAQMHRGNTVSAGQVFPMIICRVWKDEFGPGEDGVNGQVFLDGTDLYWATSVGEGTSTRSWCWPTKS